MDWPFERQKKVMQLLILFKIFYMSKAAKKMKMSRERQRILQ